MRVSTLFWLGLAAFCGGALFYTSQKVTDGRAALAALQADIRKEEESLRVLQAEWSYLNQPDRLEKLARAHLSLEPMKGRQFAEVAALEARPVPPPEGGEAQIAEGGTPVVSTQSAVAGNAAAKTRSAAAPVKANAAAGSAKMRDVAVSATIRDVAVSATIRDVAVSATIRDVAVSAPIRNVAVSATVPPSLPTAARNPGQRRRPGLIVQASPPPVVSRDDRDFGDVMKSLGVE